MAATTSTATADRRSTNAVAAAHDADMDAGGDDDPSSSLSRKRKKKARKDDAAAAGPTAGEAESSAAGAKKKQAISCDACRARKVKCHRDEPLPEGFNVKGPNVPQCQHCASLEIKCTYAYVPKKRGPPNQYLKRLQEQQRAAAGANGGGTIRDEDLAGGPSRLGGSAAGSAGESSLSPGLAGPAGVAAPGAAATVPFKLEQDLDMSASYGPNGGGGGGSGGGMVASSWLSPPPGGAETATSLYSYPHPLRPFSSFPTGASAIGSSTFNALTLPPIEPSPPVSPFAIASSGAMRPTLPSRSSTSLTTAYDGGQRPNLPSLVRTSDFGSPGDTSSGGGGGGSGAAHAVELGSPGFGGSAHGNSPSFGGGAASSPSFGGGASHSPSFAAAPSPNGGGPAGHHAHLSPSGASPPLHLSAPAHGYHPLVSDERSATVSHWMEATSLLESQQRADSAGTIGCRSGSVVGGGPARGGSVDAGMSEVDSPSLSLYSDGTSRRHRIEDVLPRDIAIYVISLFFDFVWVLTPALHKPTFLADLAMRREETDPLFFALVMSTLASTLLQVPKIQIPVPAEEVRPLASKCFRASRSVSQHFYDPPAFSMVIIRYFDTIYHYVMGNRGANTTSYVEALEIAIQLGLNNENMYEAFDPIEREMARRIFFLLFDADKSMACLLGRVISLRKEDMARVALPLEVDDECLTREAYLPQPAGKTPLIIGFNLSTRTFALLGTILETQRAVRRLPQPIEPSVIVSKLREVGGMFATASSIISEAPPAFRPHLHFDSARNSPAAGWNEAAMEQLHDYFSNPTPNQIDAKDAYQVCQGNLHVTMAWVRFVLVGYREELLELSGPPGTPSRTAAERMALNLEGSHDSREVIAVDLLNTLHSIPMQSLAVNGPSLVQKTRFVAATFLETPPSESDEARARISTYLFEFLTVLSEIEKNFAE